MNKKRNDAGVAAIILTLIMAGCYVWYAQTRSGPPPAIFNEVQIDRTTVQECVVEVSAYHGNMRSYGYGVMVMHRDEFFVLTSSMIFTEECDFVMISNGDISQEVEILYRDETLGLVALTNVYRLAYTTLTTLNDDPTIPPDVEVVVGGITVTTAERPKDGWVILDEELPFNSAGMPVTHYGRIIGMVVGLCSGDTQAIMCGNRGLNEFCDKVAEVESQ